MNESGEGAPPPSGDDSQREIQGEHFSDPVTGFDKNTKVTNTFDYRTNQNKPQESSIFDRMPTLKAENYRKLQATGEIDQTSVRPVLSEAEIQEIKDKGHVSIEVMERMFEEAENAGARGYNSVIKQYRDEIRFQTNNAQNEDWALRTSRAMDENYRAQQSAASDANTDRKLGELNNQNLMSTENPNDQPPTSSGSNS